MGAAAIIKQNYNNKYYDSYIPRTPLRKKGDKPYLYAYWRRYLKKLKTQGKLLDIGCGIGLFLMRMQDIYESYGVDISDYAVEQAKRTAVKAKIICSNVTQLPFENEFFDIITAFDTVEHLKELDLFFKNTGRILKSGGLLIISTPNPESLGAKIKKNTWHGVRDTTHINVRPAKQWRSLIEKNSFVIIRDGTDFLWDVPYFKYVPYKLQWLFFVGLTWILVWINGFYSWKFGESYICVARKV